MKAIYLLTAFSPAMFGEKASCHIRMIPHEEAQSLVGSNSRVVATRPGQPAGAFLPVAFQGTAESRRAV